MTSNNIGSTAPKRFRPAALVALSLLLLFAQSGGHAQTGDALKFFKNYFITGDYVVGGVGLTGLGVNGIATGKIAIDGVPSGADIVAAFLYWQVVAKNSLGPDAGGVGVTFKGHPLSSADGPFGKVLGAGTAPCWSAGGATGTSSGTHSTYTYRADVLRFFDIDGTPGPAQGKLAVNGDHQVQLPDGGNLTALGASLVVIYRDPAAPLSAIVLYDGSYTMGQGNESMFQTIQGFYDGNASAKLTHIVGSGQANKSERLLFNGTPIATNPFRSVQGDHWDNPTYDLTPDPSLSQVTTSVDHVGFNSFDCLTWAAVVYRTTVKDTDGDGLLDLWESWDSHSGTTPLLDPNGKPLPDLHAMGANKDVKDLFVEAGYMKTDADTTYGSVTKPAHTHLPTHAALKLVGDAFKNAPTGTINVHFDVGNSYPPGDTLDTTKNADEYIIRGTGLAKGGEAVDESATVCSPGATDPQWVCQFSAYAGTVGWKDGFRFLRDEVLSVTPPPGTQAPAPGEDFCDTPGYTCNRRFDRNRKDMFRYALFAHSIGLPKSELPCLDASNTPVAADINDACAVPTVPNPDFHAPRTNTGIGDFPGADILVTLGAFDDVNGKPVGTPFMQASTLMHELGHNFERRHGGEAFEPNCKPTYLSVMNYLYQLRGLLDDSGKPHLDFSPEAINPAIGETSLSDASLSLLPYRIGWFAPKSTSYLKDRGRPATRHCDGSDLLLTDVPMVRIDARTRASAIDWNADGISDTATFAQDVNFNGRTVKLDGTPELLRGSNDWASIRLNQIGSRRNVGGLYVVGNPPVFAVGPLSADVGKGDLGKGDLGKGDLGKGDLGKGDLGKGDLGKGDLGKGDLGKGDLGKGDLGGGDLFAGDPNIPVGELDSVTATDLAKTPPNEFKACVIGVDCVGQSSPLHRVRLGWTASNVGGVGQYGVFRVEGTTLVPGQPWISVGHVDSVLGQIDYSVIDGAQLVNGAPYTYFAVAIYQDGIQSDPSNLVTITAVNDPPVAGNDSYSTDEDTTLSQAAPGVLANDADPDSPSSLTAALVSGPLHGTLTLASDGSFTYKPVLNYNGPDSFSYKANDGTVDTNIATVSITVNAVNDAPTFTPPANITTPATSAAGAVVTFTATGGDVEDGTIAAVCAPASASTFPIATTTVSCTVTDTGGLTATGSFTVTVTNNAPVANNDSYSTNQGTVLTVPAPGVLGNDTDVETPSSLTAALFAGPSNGALTLNANGSFTYTPNASFSGSDSFTYRASDGSATSAVATVSITVNPVVYTFVGLQNVPPPSGKTFKAGSAIPMKWQFTNGSTVVNSSLVGHVVTVSGPLPGGPIRTITNTDPGSSSFRYDALTNTWQFNLQTREQSGQNYPVGVYNVTITPTTPGYLPSGTFQIQLVK